MIPLLLVVLYSVQYFCVCAYMLRAAYMLCVLDAVSCVVVLLCCGNCFGMMKHLVHFFSHMTPCFGECG